MKPYNLLFFFSLCETHNKHFWLSQYIVLMLILSQRIPPNIKLSYKVLPGVWKNIDELYGVLTSFLLVALCPDGFLHVQIMSLFNLSLVSLFAFRLTGQLL